MGRLKDLRNYVDAEINRMENVDKRTGAIAHLYGVSLAAAMIARKRGLDAELLAMAAMLHDLHAYKGSGSCKADPGRTRSDKRRRDRTHLFRDLSS